MGQIWEVPRLQPTCNRTQIAAQGLEQATARGRPGSACVGQGPGPGATREGGRVRASDATPRSPPWRVLVLSCPCFDSASPAPHLDTDLGPCTASQVRQICFSPFGTHPRLHRRQCPDQTAQLRNFRYCSNPRPSCRFHRHTQSWPFGDISCLQTWKAYQTPTGQDAIPGVGLCRTHSVVVVRRRVLMLSKFTQTRLQLLFPCSHSSLRPRGRHARSKGEDTGSMGRG
jgi:hypothetical protein